MAARRSPGSSPREGKLVIYISHRMAEVRDVADRLTVFRNGMTVAAPRGHARSATTRSSPRCSAAASTGSIPSASPTATDRVALRVRDLSAGQRLRGVDLDLREGEVLGVGGLQGHGQRELFQALFGAGRAQRHRSSCGASPLACALARARR